VLWFIPQSIQEGPAVERQRALRFVRLAFGFGGLGAALSIALLVTGGLEPALYDLAGAAVIGLTPLLLRWTGSLRLASHLMIGCLAGVMFLLAPGLGGVHAPHLPVLSVCPILAVLLVGRRAALFWGAIVALLYVLLYALDAMAGIDVPAPFDAHALALIETVSLCALAALALGFVYLYDRGQERALALARDANQRMIDLIAHLDATGQALGRSAAEFLGADAGVDGAPAVGLTQQMLTTAGSSRAMIQRVQGSIRGMIEQYSLISIRVRELSQLSGTIAEMVHTIDSISDRLDLMALNTGIEAANAGAAGRRFQLLAEDMRRLAERVLGETTRIKDSIRAVQAHTQAATDASLTGQALTDDGRAQLEAMARVFDGLYALIERTADASRRITTETKRQLGVIQSLVQTALREEAGTLEVAPRPPSLAAQAQPSYVAGPAGPTRPASS
jgi:hypothetical protein